MAKEQKVSLSGFSLFLVFTMEATCFLVYLVT